MDKLDELYHKGLIAPETAVSALKKILGIPENSKMQGPYFPADPSEKPAVSQKAAHLLDTAESDLKKPHESAPALDEMLAKCQIQSPSPKFRKMVSEQSKHPFKPVEMFGVPDELFDVLQKGPVTAEQFNALAKGDPEACGMPVHGQRYLEYENKKMSDFVEISAHGCRRRQRDL